MNPELQAWVERCRREITAPPGSRCIFCGTDVTGSYTRKIVYAPAPELGKNRIKPVGMGWSCSRCQTWEEVKKRKKEGREYYKPWWELIEEKGVRKFAEERR